MYLPSLLSFLICLPSLFSAISLSPFFPYVPYIFSLYLHFSVCPSASLSVSLFVSLFNFPCFHLLALFSSSFTFLFSFVFSFELLFVPCSIRKKSSVPHVFPLPSLHHYSILVLSLFSPFLLSLSLVLFSPSPLCTPSRPPHCSGGPEERIPAGQAARRELGRSPEVLGVIHCRGAREGTTSRRNGGRKPGRTSVVIDEMTGRRWQLLLSAGTSDEGLPPPPRPPGEEKKIEHAEPPREKLDLIHGVRLPPPLSISKCLRV